MKYKVKFESVPVMYVESDTEKGIREEVINAWVLYSGYDLPNYEITEIKEEE